MYIDQLIIIFIIIHIKAVCILQFQLSLAGKSCHLRRIGCICQIRSCIAGYLFLFCILLLFCIFFCVCRIGFFRCIRAFPGRTLCLFRSRWSIPTAATAGKQHGCCKEHRRHPAAFLINIFLHSFSPFVFSSVTVLYLLTNTTIFIFCFWQL